MSNQRYTYTVAFEADASKVTNAVKELQKNLNDISSPIFRMDDASKSLNEAKKSAAELQSHLTKAFNVHTGQLNLDAFMKSINSGNKSLKQYSKDLISLGPQGVQSFQSLAKAISAAETPLKSSVGWMEKLSQTFANTIRWSISSKVIQGFSGAIRDAYDYAQDLNESLNNIRIVTGKSVAEMRDFAKEANAAAKALSTTTTKYTDASLIYYQQGIASQKEIQERTDATVKLANITGQSVETVSDQLTSVWNNFDNGSKSLEYYVDVMTKLGAATASSSDEIATGLEKFAAVSNTIGLSYEYAAAALTTVTATTRQSADVVGTAFKTLFSRMEQLKLGETLDDGTTLGQYSKALAVVGVNIKDVNGELKDMDQILDETGAKWQDLSRDEKTALAQSVAGIRQYQQFIALMDNWDFFEKNVEAAKSSTGTLNEQNEIYAQSWEAASERAKAAAEGIYDSLLKDDFFIGLTNTWADFLGAIEKVIDSLGGFKGVLGTITPIVTTLFRIPIINQLRNIGNSIMINTGLLQKKNLASKQELIQIEEEVANYRSLTQAEKIEQQSLANLHKLKVQLALISKTLTEAEKIELQSKLDMAEKNMANISTLKEELALKRQLANAATDKAIGKTGGAVSYEALQADMQGKDNRSARRLVNNVIKGAGGTNMADKSQTVNTQALIKSTQSTYEGFSRVRLVLEEVNTELHGIQNTTNESTENVSSMQQQLVKVGQNLLQNGKLNAADQAIIKNKIAAIQKGNLSFEETKTISGDLLDISSKKNGYYMQQQDILKQMLMTIMSTEEADEALANSSLERLRLEKAINEEAEKLKNTKMSPTVQPFDTAAYITNITTATSATTGFVSSIKGLNEQFKNGEATFGTVLSSLSGMGTTAVMAAPAVKDLFTKAIKGATGLQKALGWIGLVLSLLPIIVEIGDALITTSKEAKEKINETAEAFKAAKEEVKSLEEEIDSLKQKINELSKNGLTLTEASEVRELQQAIALRERELALAKQKEEYEKDKRNSTFAKQYNKSYGELINAAEYIQHDEQYIEFLYREKATKAGLSKEAQEAQLANVTGMADLVALHNNYAAPDELIENVNFSTLDALEAIPALWEGVVDSGYNEQYFNDFVKIQKAAYGNDPTKYYAEVIQPALEALGITNIDSISDQQATDLKEIYGIDASQIKSDQQAVIDRGAVRWSTGNKMQQQWYNNLSDEDKRLMANVTPEADVTRAELNKMLEDQHQQNLVSAIDLDGLDEKAVTDYTASLMELAETSNDIPDYFKDDEIAAKQYAVQIMKTQRGLESFTESQEEWADALKGDQSLPQYSEALRGMRDALSDVTGVAEDELPDSFVTSAETMRLMEEAANGDKEALKQLRLEASKAMLVNFKFEGKEEVKGQIESLINDFYANEYNDLEFGASLDDSPFVASLTTMLENGQITVDEMNRILEGIGVTPAVDWIEVPIEEAASYKGLFTGNVEVPDPNGEPGATKSVSLDNISSTMINGGGMVKIPIIGKQQASIRAQAGLKGHKIVTNAATFKQSNVTPNLNKSKGGGGGKRERKKIDIYKDEEAQIKRLTDAVEKLASAEEYLWGESKLKNLQAQNEALKEQVGYMAEYQKFLDSNQATQKQSLLDNLAGYGITNVKFAADGSIINSEEVENLLEDWKMKTASEVGDEKVDKTYELIEDYNTAVEKRLENAQDIVDSAKDFADNWSKRFEAANEQFEVSIDKFDKAANKYQTNADLLTGREKIDALGMAEDALVNQHYQTVQKIQATEGQMQDQNDQLYTLLKALGLEDVIRIDSETRKITNLDELSGLVNDSTSDAAVKAEVLGILSNWNDARDDYAQQLEDEVQLERDIRNTRLEGLEAEVDLMKEMKETFQELQDLSSKINETFSSNAVGKFLNDFNEGVQSASFNSEQAQQYLNIYNRDKALYDSLGTIVDEKGNVINDPQAVQDYLDRVLKNGTELIEGLLDYVKNFSSYTKDLFDAIKEEMDEMEGTLNHAKTLISSAEEIMKLTGQLSGRQGLQRTVGLAQQSLAASRAQAKIDAAEVTKTKAVVDAWKTELARTPIGSGAYVGIKENYDAAVKLFQEAQQAQFKSAKEAMEAAKKLYEAELELAAYEFEQIVTKSMGFEFQQMRYDNLLADDERYLDIVNQTIELNSLSRKIQESIDNQASKAGKAKLSAIAKEIDAMKERNDISKFELDIMQKRYDLTLKEIALEEARNAKTSMRLARDASGNWSYVYTANQDTINSAQEEVDRANQDIYNTAKQEAISAQGEMIKLEKETANALKDLDKRYRSGEISEEEYKNQPKAIRDQAVEQYSYLENQFNLALTTAAQAGEKVVDDFGNNYLKELAEMTVGSDSFALGLDELINNMTSAGEAYQGTVGDIAEETGTTLEELGTILNEADKTVQNINATYETFINTAYGSIGKVKEITDTYRSQITVIKQLSDAYLGALRNKKALEGLRDNVTYNGSSGIYHMTSGDNSGTNIGSIVYGENSGKYYVNQFGAGQQNPSFNTLAEAQAYKESIGMATGGYTGAWGPEGRLALLHQKELVLNAKDTANMLQMVEYIREFEVSKAIQDLNKQLLAAQSLLQLKAYATNYGASQNNLQQNVHIEANFPGVESAAEIERAFNDLINQAAQFASTY